MLRFLPAFARQMPRTNRILGQGYRNKSLRDLELIVIFCTFPLVQKGTQRHILGGRRNRGFPLPPKNNPHLFPDGDGRFRIQQRLYWSKKGDGYCVWGFFLSRGFASPPNDAHQPRLGAIHAPIIYLTVGEGLVSSRLVQLAKILPLCNIQTNSIQPVGTGVLDWP